MTVREPLTYRDAGVDLDAAAVTKRRLRELVESTRTEAVQSDFGSFGGRLTAAGEELVASADGVGTKLEVAIRSGRHDTVGEDLVNHCVNDILVQGARPLFFMDYVATGRLEPGVLASVVDGIGRGCRETGCALLGGETAEMPGFYGDDEYDVVGFVVGIVDRAKILDGSRVREGDLLIGLASSGLHTNGYSLARRIFFDVAGLSVDSNVDGVGATVGEILLREHRSYLGALSGPVGEGRVHALAHITGGGLTDNLPRVLPEGLGARIRRTSWPVPGEFSYMERIGGVERDEMFRTFNMGVGMVAIVAPEDAAALEAHLEGAGQQHWRIGKIVAGNGRVDYE